MPAARLTIPADGQVTDAVRAVLAGCDLATVAAETGMEEADLADATDAYHLAGTAALEHHAHPRWHQVNVRPAGPDQADRTLATLVGPRLDTLVTAGAASGWWYLNKTPGWRIRVLDADTDTLCELLAALAAAGTIAAWNPAIYEPETAAFGGDAGMDIAHTLFCADTTGVLNFLRAPSPPLGRRELSVLLISALCAAAGLDWYERGDVFTRIAAMRPDPPPAAARTGLAAQLRTLLTASAEAESPLFNTGGPATFAAPWRDTFEQAGHHFGAAATAGTLDRGLRATLAHTVIFHWNRLGLSAITQAALARAAAHACLLDD